MSGPLHSPSYLKPSPSGYIFRFCIPKDLVPLVGKTELRYSLRTGEIGLAKCRAREMAVCVQRVIRSIRKGGPLAKLKADQIDGLLKQYLKEAISEDEDLRVKLAGVMPRGHVDWSRRFLERLINSYTEGLGYNDITPVKHIAGKILARYGVECDDTDSSEFKMLCRELLKVEREHCRVALKRFDGDYDYEKRVLADLMKPDPLQPVTLPAVPATTPAQVEEQAKSSPLVSEVVRKFAEERAEGWTEKTRGEYIDDSLTLFVEAMGDIPINAVNRDVVREFRDSLRRLPPNRKKLKVYRGKTIQQLLEMDLPAERCLSVLTVKKHLSRLTSFLDFAVADGHLPTNPAYKMPLHNPTSDRDARNAFERSDLIRIFHSTPYLQDTHKESYQFWLPVLGLFTGARLNELCQLHLDDIRQEDGEVWFLDINRDGEGKRRKNKTALRIVPLHPVLVEDFDFIGYVEWLRGRPKVKRLFPELPLGRDGYAKNASRWFNGRFKKQCGFDPEADAKKVFHSFRHTFITHLEHKEVHDGMLHQTTGHSRGKTETKRRYSKQFSAADVYREVILQIDYGVDLDHLKRSRYVTRRR